MCVRNNIVHVRCCIPQQQHARIYIKRRGRLAIRNFASGTATCRRSCSVIAYHTMDRWSVLYSRMPSVLLPEAKRLRLAADGRPHPRFCCLLTMMLTLRTMAPSGAHRALNYRSLAMATTESITGE
jgi:hypothetical protein